MNESGWGRWTRRPDNPFCNKCPDRFECEYTISNPCNKLKRELDRLWGVEKKDPKQGRFSYYPGYWDQKAGYYDRQSTTRISDLVNALPEDIERPDLRAEENLFNWLSNYKQLSDKQICECLGISYPPTPAKIARKMQDGNNETWDKRGRPRKPRRVVMVKERDKPIRKIVTEKGYPDLPRKSGRPGKYEKKRDYSFYGKHKKSLGISD
ncbi:MAG: hypothetical protein R6U13_08935 [Desulfatiglandaceae bacterium]